MKPPYLQYYCEFTPRYSEFHLVCQITHLNTECHLLYTCFESRDRLNPMPQQLIITATGPDRPGIVGELTGALHAGGGNILDSRMVNLRGEFAMLILLEAAEEAAEGIRKTLAQTGEKMGLRLTISELHRGPRTYGLPFRLKTYSLDQPGIVARISLVLRQFGVNIEDLSARQESAPFDGSPLFLTEMRLTVPATVSLGKLRGELEAVGNALNCDIDLDPA
jgi:glycine cleavage system transcriptional repressor